MNELLEILKYILPSLLVAALAFFMIKAFLDNSLNKDKQEVLNKNHETALPIRLQAYERIILFLERISPYSLVLRVNKAGMSGDNLRDLLIRTVREEYDHNVSQQLYVSSQAWDLVKNAKEEVIRIINTSSAKLPDKADSSELSKKVIELYLDSKNKAVDQAMIYIKKEAASLF